ncbi:MAG: hypothetical protein AB7K09_06305 [Planctomycetota bacterium]
MLIAFASPLAAQDSHYETNQYGADAALRGGTATAGVRDTSAVWYNPAALGFLDNPSISVNANAYRIGESNLGDFAGTGEDIKSTPLTTVPLLVSGLLMEERLLPGHRFAFAIINRTVSQISINSRLREIRDVLDRGNFTTAGNEDYAATLTADSDITEIWGAIAWGYKIIPELSVGTSLFGALRQHSLGFTAVARAVNPNIGGAVATADLTEKFQYLNLRLLMRIGIAVDLGNVKLGLSFTTPSGSLFGEGGVLLQASINNVDVNGDTFGDAGVMEDSQQSLAATFESNMALALGAQVQLNHLITLAFEVEWNAAAGRFSIMTPEARNLIVGSGFVFLTTDDFTPTYRYTTTFNFGFSMAFRFSTAVSLLFGFNTDLSYAPDDTSYGVDLIVTDYDMFSITSGVVISEYGDKDYNKNRLIREVSAGISFTFGRGGGTQLVNFGAATEANYLIGLGATGPTSVGYFAFSLVLGFTQHF